MGEYYVNIFKLFSDEIKIQCQHLVKIKVLFLHDNEPINSTDISLVTLIMN